MEYLAVAVIVVSIAILGILISVGNARQKKAIDDLRRHVADWAEQDIRLKREKLAREVKVSDPLEWFGRVIALVTGEKPSLIANYETASAPETIVVHSKNPTEKFILSTADPKKARQLGKNKNRIAGASAHPLHQVMKNTPSFELSVLTAGMFFDLEAPLAWQAITETAESGIPGNKLWLYVVN